MLGYRLIAEFDPLARKVDALIRKGGDLSAPLKATADWMRVDAKRRLFARESDDVTGALWKSLEIAAFPHHAEVSSPLPYARIQNEGGTVYPKGKALAQPVRKQERRAHVWPRNFPGALFFRPAPRGKFPVIGYLFGYATNTKTYLTQRYRQAQARSKGRKVREVAQVLLYILRKWTKIPSRPGNRWGPYLVWSKESAQYLRHRLELWFGLSGKWRDVG